jgi:hypothetical protein
MKLIGCPETSATNYELKLRNITEEQRCHFFKYNLIGVIPLCCGSGSVVGIAISYGLDGPGSNPDEGEIFRTCPDRPWGPASLLYNQYRDFLGGKERPGRDAEPSPPSSAAIMKEYSYTSTPLKGRMA